MAAGGIGMGGSCFRHGRSRMAIAIRPSHPYDAGTEHVRFFFHPPGRRERGCMAVHGGGVV